MSNFYERSMPPEELHCNRCEAVFPYLYSDERTMTIQLKWMQFVICKACTDEVAKAMGLTEKILEHKMSSMRRAETENNRKREVKEGTRCFKCEEKFKRDEPRVKVDECSNTKAYHLACYP